jgi:hypothetical protein
MAEPNIYHTFQTPAASEAARPRAGYYYQETVSEGKHRLALFMQKGAVVATACMTIEGNVITAVKPGDADVAFCQRGMDFVGF